MQIKSNNKTCPVCEEWNVAQLFTIGDIDQPLSNVICKSCALVFIDDLNNVDDYEQYQAVSGKGSGHHRKRTDEEWAKKIHGSDGKIKSQVVSYLLPYIGKDAKVLDIGCGIGNLLNLIKEQAGVLGEGIEMNANDITLAKNFFGINLYYGSLEKFYNTFSGKEKYNLIILHHTLEHLLKPLKELWHIRKLLAPQGVLYIGVPNIMNIKKRPEFFFIRGHAFNYSPATLRKMLHTANFKIISFNEDAAYPGGMEVIAVPHEDHRDGMPTHCFSSGSTWREIDATVAMKKKKFDRLRILKHILFFWVPLELRNKIAKKAHNAMVRYL